MQIIKGGAELIPEIKETWELLNEHHIEKSIFFKDRFRTFTFEKRSVELIKKANKGKTLVLLAKNNGVLYGHCVSTIIEEQGEIETIFIKKDLRKTGLGNSFMLKTMKWFEENNINNINLMIANGNEEVIDFYSKYGFTSAGLKLKYNSKSLSK